MSSFFSRGAAIKGMLVASMLLLPLGALAQPQAPVPDLPSIESFFTPPELQSARLSPSGRWLAAVVQPQGARARLVVSDLEGKEAAKVVAQFSRADVNTVRWISEDWLVFDTRDTVDRSGREPGPGLMSVRRDGERMRLLIKREWDTEFAAGGANPLEANHEMLALGALGTNEIIVGEYPLDAGGEFSYVRPFVLNAESGARRKLSGNAPAGMTDWVFDVQGRPRAAILVKGNRVVAHWHDLATGEWRVIGDFERLAVDFWPAFVDGADNLYVEHKDSAGYSAMSRFDLATGKIAAEPLVSTPGFSGGVGVIQSRRDGALLAVDVLTDASSRVWLLPELKAIQAKVDAKLPGRINRVSCGGCSKPVNVLVHSSSDRHPGEYLIYQPEADKWQRIGVQRPAVDPRRMATMEFHRTKARDGKDLPVWITRTPGGDAKPRPAVVLVHGGPWARGAQWRWKDDAQFLASRGYVVIEPEFRGSTGYGDDHYRAGWKQWGQAMQDDVTDALRFAVQRGWVDDKRVCIAGASYGGYATLMGLAKDPEQYRCGVAWVGVSDPRLMFSIHWSNINRDNKKHTMPAMIGDPEKDAAMLAANSPLEHAFRIKAPVFLAYGRKDRRVPIEHGERMRDALRKAGNEPQWVVYDDEGHGWERPENTIDFWRKVEAFLAKNLK